MTRPAPVQPVDSVVVSEVFGPTLQGEGPNLGLRAAFVRMGGCNLHCRWCDTPYTWDARRFDLREQLTRVPVASIVEQVAAMDPRVVVVTGGEPLLWQGSRAWSRMLSGLADIAPVEIETNGTADPVSDQPVACYNVSPKLAHSGDPAEVRIKLPTLRKFADLARSDRAALKIVVITPRDVRAAAQLARDARWPLSRVYVMPEGTTPQRLAQVHGQVADAVLEEGLNMTTRLHVLCWGQERGR